MTSIRFLEIMKHHVQVKVLPINFIGIQKIGHFSLVQFLLV